MQEPITFKEMVKEPALLKAIAASGFVHPTPVQELSIPHVLAGSDLFAAAETGTGKTAAFLIPIFEKILAKKKTVKGPKVLILAPTRELAMQIADEATRLGKLIGNIYTVPLFGGACYHWQKRQLSKPYDIIVATPGRLIDHMEDGKINWDHVEFLVLDEADRMLDIGFADSIETIVSYLPAERQTLLFSATLSPKVKNLSQKVQNNPEEVKTNTSIKVTKNVTQKLYMADDMDHKKKLLDHFLAIPVEGQTIIFIATKAQAEELKDRLEDEGHRAVALHGDMRQRERTRTMDRFRKGQFDVMIATDVASRGLDVRTIRRVINFDLPFEIEDYVHRVGRTGRGGDVGHAITFATGKQSALIGKIEKCIGATIERDLVAGLEPKKKERDFSSNSGGRSSSRGGRSSGGKSNFFSKDKKPSFGARRGDSKKSSFAKKGDFGGRKRSFQGK